MPNNDTLFKRLDNFLIGQSGNVPASILKQEKSSAGDAVLFSTKNKDEYERKLAQLRQQKLQDYQWVKAGVDVSSESLAGYTAVKLMYRDADLMDGSCEIGTALDIMSQEVCPLSSKGKMLNIYSKSQRVKSILEDLFINRLNIHIELPAIARNVAKYGNEFRLLNISGNDGVLGWKHLPTYEIDRIENGTNSIYGNGAYMENTIDNVLPGDVNFVWNGHNESLPYRNWQVAHFRMLTDTFFLPYGTSCLHKARRAWRMWSMMEDAMLIYRLDKSIERRVFKIYVGAIDDADVQAYVQQVANNFKRTPICDPETGQVDLRKNFLDVSQDYFIPVRSESAPNPIESLGGATWQNQMEDIEYMQNKIFAAMQIPKSYLNFQEAQGKGENLSVKDIRFGRMLNRIQQYLLTELNKIAMIHLYSIGMRDDVANFSLSLNNPSNQIEEQELDNLTKRVGVASQVLADPGIGMPLFSLHRTLKEVMKMSDKEIKEMLNEIRLEKAMAAELENTASIIKKTGIFDSTDRIYGDYEAMNGGAQQGGQAPGAEGGDMAGGGAMGGGMMPDLGGDMGGDLGGDMGGDMGADMGAEGGVDMGGAPEADAGGAAPEAPNEAIHKSNNLLTEKVKSFTERYFDLLSESEKTEENEEELDVDYEKQIDLLNEKINDVLDKADQIISENIEDDDNDDLHFIAD